MDRSTVPQLIEQKINPAILCVGIVLVGLGGLYFSTVIRNPYTLLYPSALIIGTISYILLSMRSQTEIASFSSKTGKLVLLLYFIALFAVTLSYYVAGFWRSDAVFYLTFSLYALTGLYCFINPNTLVSLLLIFSSGAINRITAHYASERYIGVDIYGHSSHIAAISADGALETFETSKYFYAPFYHIQTAIGEIVLNISVKDSLTLLVIMSFLAISILAIYVITNIFWSSQTALVASLLYTFSDQVLSRAIHPIPNTLGVALFVLVVLVICWYLLTHQIRSYILFTILFSTLMLTHQVSLFVTAVAVGTLATVISLKHSGLGWRNIRILIFAGFIVFLDFVITKYSGPAAETSFFDRVLGTFVGSLLESSGVESRAEVSFPQDTSVSPGGAAAMADIQLVGSMLLLLFAIVGALYWLESQRTTFFFGLGFGMTATVMMFVTLAGPVIGMRNLMPNRWWPFIYLFLAVFAAVGIKITIQTVSSAVSETNVPIIQVLLLFVLLIPFVTLMVGAGTASADNPFIDDGFDAQRYGITESEVAATEYPDQYAETETTVLADRRFSSSVPYQTRTVQMEHLNPDSIPREEPQLLINRSYITEQPAQYIVEYQDTTWSVHGGVPTNKISSEYRMTLYSNGKDEILQVQR